MPSCTEILLWLIMILTSTFYALSAPFLPVMFEEKGIHQTYVGVVFAAFSVAIIIFSPFVTGMIERFGQPALLGWGFVLMGVS
jgi:MFS family permease